MTGPNVLSAAGVAGGEAVNIREAQNIFRGIAADYEGPAQLFGLGLYRSWHRRVVDLVNAEKPKLVLDMCTGTGAISSELVKRTSARVVAVDITRDMLRAAAKRTDLPVTRVAFVQGAAQQPPLRDGAFDVVVFSYLLRYVTDVRGTIAALGRLVRPGGLIVSLEFGVPPHPLARAAWNFYTNTLMPAGLRLLSPGWDKVGGFLGPSIRRFYNDHSIPLLESYYREAGFDVRPTRQMSLGGGVLMAATRRMTAT